MNGKNRFLIYLLAAFLIFTAGYSISEKNKPPIQTETAQTASGVSLNEAAEETAKPTLKPKTESIELKDVPEYTGNPYTVINDNKPFFTEADYTAEPFELYSPLDSLGRCGTAYANICIDIMPTEERGNIGMVKPTGWHTIRYDNVDGQYLYNRCHLIGYQLAGENANELNFITGTRYLNVTGMLPFENMVADYVNETHNHVLYRVTPVFEGGNLLAAGVIMEGLSVEDKGAGILFNVFCHNVQPDIEIDYATGESKAAPTQTPVPTIVPAIASTPSPAPQSGGNTGKVQYIGNKNSKKFHYPYCSSVSQMKEKNKVYLYGSRNDAIAKGYHSKLVKHKIANRT